MHVQIVIWYLYFLLIHVEYWFCGHSASEITNNKFHNWTTETFTADIIYEIIVLGLFEPSWSLPLNSKTFRLNCGDHHHWKFEFNKLKENYDHKLLVFISKKHFHWWWHSQLKPKPFNKRFNNNDHGLIVINFTIL